jgi:hypothetical protein
VPVDWPQQSSRPVRRAGTSAVQLDDNLALYDDVGQLLILLNWTAAAVWELCDGSTTVEEMARSLSETHDATPDLVGEDVRQTVRKLAELGLVEDGAGVCPA